MTEEIYLLNMFPDYQPPEELQAALSQAAIAAGELDMETRSASVILRMEQYVPQRLLDRLGKEIARLYGLRGLELTGIYPASQLHKIETDELMQIVHQPANFSIRLTRLQSR